MTRLDGRRVHRAGVLVGGIGASLVVTAIFTDSKATVAASDLDGGPDDGRGEPRSHAPVSSDGLSSCRN
jgi:hypothetical protein